MDRVVETFRRVLREVDELPPFPAVFFQILAVTSDERSSREELIRLVSLDQAVAAKVLQTINSAYYGVGQKVSSLPVALGLLGDKRVRELTLLCAASGMLRRTIRGYGIPADAFWFHSVAAAIAARLIAERKAPELRETAYAAGLLHDIGKLVVDRFIRDELMAEFREVPGNVPRRYFDLENRTLGFDHCTVGFFLARRWNFPEELQSAVAHHHYADAEVEHLGLVRIVHVADAFSHMMAMGILDLDFIASLSETGEMPLGLSGIEVIEIIDRLRDEAADAKVFLGL